MSPEPEHVALRVVAEKDIVDLERLVAVQGAKLDAGYVRRWMVEMMGEQDERVTRWDQLVRDFGER
ncbi:MAG: hypothetical protein ACOZNI_08160 [Myxococcota bacterium]